MAYNVPVAVLVGNGFDLAAGLQTGTQRLMREFVHDRLGDSDPIDAEKVELDGFPGDRLALRMLREGVDLWADYERKIGEYASDCAPGWTLTERADEYRAAKDELDGFLLDRLSQEADRLSEEFVVDNAAECVGSLASWFNGLQPLERRAISDAISTTPWALRYKLVCFNYTPTLERMYLKTKGSPFKPAPGSENGIISSHQISEFHYAHGTISGIPVAGVDDADQIADDELSGVPEVQRAVCKPNVLSMLATGADRDALHAIASSKIVIIFGMSMGASDRRWWRAVIDLLKAKPDSFVVICTREMSSMRRTPDAYQRIMMSRKAHLFDAAEVPKDDAARDELSTRIFLLPSEGIFRFPKPLPAEQSAGGESSE